MGTGGQCIYATAGQRERGREGGRERERERESERERERELSRRPGYSILGQDDSDLFTVRFLPSFSCV